jgi:hypothetical protein
MRETHNSLIFLVWLLGDHDRLVQMRAILTAASLLVNCLIHKRSHNIEIISNFLIQDFRSKEREVDADSCVLRYDAAYSGCTLKIEAEYSSEKLVTSRIHG